MKGFFVKILETSERCDRHGGTVRWSLLEYSVIVRGIYVSRERRRKFHGILNFEPYLGLRGSREDVDK